MGLYYGWEQYDNCWMRLEQSIGNVDPHSHLPIANSLLHSYRLSMYWNSRLHSALVHKCCESFFLLAGYTDISFLNRIELFTFSRCTCSTYWMARWRALTVHYVFCVSPCWLFGTVSLMIQSTPDRIWGFGSVCACVLTLFSLSTVSADEWCWAHNAPCK